MSESPEALRTLIEGANAAGPGPARLAAVRARLEAQLGPLDAPRAAPPAAPLSGLGKAGLGLVVVTVGIALWLGTRPPVEAPQPEPRAEVQAASGEAARAVPTTTGVAPTHEVEAPVPEVVPTPTAEEPQSRRTARPARETLEPAVEPTATDTASSLREEIALMDRALRAREAGDLADARRALEEHRRRFPTGTLGLERDRMAAELGAETEPAP